MSPGTQSDPHHPLVNTHGVGAMAASSEYSMTPSIPCAKPRHKECDLPQSYSSSPPNSLILTDKGTRYVRPTDHPEGLGEIQLSSWESTPKELIPRYFKFANISEKRTVDYQVVTSH